MPLFGLLADVRGDATMFLTAAAAASVGLLTVAQVDNNKVQIGGGGSGWVLDGRLRFDAAFAWIFFSKLDITNSAVTQVNAEVFPSCPAPVGELCVEPAVVGNGKGTSHGWIIAAQAQYIFKKKKKA